MTETLSIDEQPYKIPDNWQWVYLSDVLKISKNTTKDFNKIGLKYVGLENIERDSGKISFQTAYDLKSIKNIFYKNDILYGKLRPNLNKHGLAKFDGICSTDILVCNSNELSLNKFINYFFHQNYFITYVIENSNGITLPRVSEKVILNAKFPLPPLDEQQRIVERIESLFSKLDKANEKLNLIVGFNDLKNTTIGKIDLMKKAILSRAFRGEL